MKNSFLALAVSLCLGTVAHANLIVNGDFENPNIGSAPFKTYTGSGIPGWTIAPGTNVDIVNAGYFGAGANSGTGQFVDLNGTGPGSQGEMSQDFATLSGATYQLTFLYANNFIGGPSSSSAQVEITVSGLNTMVTHSTSSSSGLDWTQFTATFVAGSNLSTLTLKSLVAAGNGGVLFDNIVIEQIAAPIPEPASMIAMGSGVIGLFAFARRRMVKA